MSKKHVFLAYAREDVRIASKIRKYLNRLDVPVWHDIQELQGGDEWERDIITALKMSSALILVLTPASMRSSFVAFEWAFARGAGARFIPVLAEHVDLPRPLASTNYVDFTNRRKPWNALADALLKPALEKAVEQAGPRLVAHFSIDDGRPWYEEGDELAVELQIGNAPKGASEVRYQLHSKTFNRSYRHSRSMKAEKGFKKWRQSYGDVLVSATIVMPTGEVTIRDTLYNMLKTSHGRDRRRHVREALEQIRDN